MSGTDPRPELFSDVAAQFENLEQPLNLQWMQDRRVTLEEVNAVSQKIALIIRGYCALEPADRIVFVTRGLMSRSFEEIQTNSKPAETVIGQRNASANEQPS